MAFRSTIAAKIFGLAIFLLLLTIGLSSYLLLEAFWTGSAVETLAKLDAPLSRSIADIDEYGLRRRVAFERAYGALASASPDEATLREATGNFEHFSGKLMAEYAVARAIIEAYPREAIGRDVLIEVRTILDELEAGFQGVTARETELLALMRRGDREQARNQLGLLSDLLRGSQSQRAVMLEKVSGLVVNRADSARARQAQVLVLSVAVTASTVLLGLMVAWLIANRLTAPVRRLVSAVKDAQGGNLGVRLPVGSPDEIGVLTESFNYFIAELQAKEELKRTFGKYVDPRILKHLMAGQGTTLGGGGRSRMTILFGDLAGFTGMSERLTPSVMVSVLNRHFGLQASAIQEQGGIVDKFIGDAVMAFWGPPFSSDQEHALLACRSALRQVEMAAALRAELPDLTGLRRDAPALDLRIGIETGDVVVGNIGSETTCSFTVIGDTVNLTSRIERANRMYGTRILLGEATARSVSEVFLTREIDSVAVKGKQETTKLFELMGLKAGAGEPLMLLRERYEASLEKYRAQDWDGAEAELRACLAIAPDDGPTKVLLERIGHLRRQPPIQPWDGTWHMKDK